MEDEDESRSGKPATDRRGADADVMGRGEGRGEKEKEEDEEGEQQQEEDEGEGKGEKEKGEEGEERGESKEAVLSMKASYAHREEKRRDRVRTSVYDCAKEARERERCVWTGQRRLWKQNESS
ncbi:hypothetical protein GOP47_0018208 [Adiantum capillus-veneris]|uniref:Uncharacterized protein n=1 Tax=Adiantum capillus-veneris TaxID=13818 RepID=A0A9D4UH32_ADICA|nr:hypothetical protein GOP47_0018208 [Adiantum capillus-veneris]